MDDTAEPPITAGVRHEGSSALLVIDMQLVAFDGTVTPPIVDGARLLGSVSTLIDGCRSKGIPIVYLQTSAAAGNAYARDVHGWEIHPRISPHGGDRVVIKQNSSGFDGTSLVEVLTGLGIGTVLVCGIWSEHCVTNTCLDALRLGFRTIVAGDGHGTVAPSEGEARRIVCQQNSRLMEAGVTACRVSELIKARQPKTRA